MESNHQLELMRLLRYRFSNPLLNLYSCLASRLGFEPRMLILEIKVLPITLSRYTILERVIGVEPTTITLATWRSTSWATPALIVFTVFNRLQILHDWPGQTGSVVHPLLLCTVVLKFPVLTNFGRAILVLAEPCSSVTCWSPLMAYTYNAWLWVCVDRFWRSQRESNSPQRRDKPLY